MMIFVALFLIAALVLFYMAYAALHKKQFSLPARYGNIRPEHVRVARRLLALHFFVSGCGMVGFLAIPYLEITSDQKKAVFYVITVVIAFAFFGIRMMMAGLSGRH